MSADLIGMNEASRDAGLRLGAAVDLGTTEVRVCVWDLTRDRRLGCGLTPNPQIEFGQDVLSRLSSAAETPELAGRVRNVALDAIGKSIRDICSQLSVSESAVRKVVIVGNTAMLALLTGQGYSELLQPRSWSRHIECQFADPGRVSSSWGLGPDCSLDVLQPLAGFVGSDLSAGLIATGLAAGPACSLLIDFGANTEIGLWDGTKMWATSTAGGPAFENSGVDSGISAQPGAIWRIERTSSATKLDFSVIGNARPRGLCASGLVDAVALLLASGQLSPAGRFVEGASGRSAIALSAQEGVFVTSRDVDALQRGKAGVAAATQCLLARADMTASDLKRVCVSGAFGSHLDARNAVDIGLVPPVAADLVELFENTALTGCESVMRGKARPLAHHDVAVVNMSHLRHYEEVFVDNLFLRPWSSHSCEPRKEGTLR